MGYISDRNLWGKCVRTEQMLCSVGTAHLANCSKTVPRAYERCYDNNGKQVYSTSLDFNAPYRPRLTTDWQECVSNQSISQCFDDKERADKEAADYEHSRIQEAGLFNNKWLIGLVVVGGLLFIGKQYKWF